jgi:putative oxidoreductase
MIKMAKSKLNEWSLTALRVVLGLVFMYHGCMKLFVAGGFPGTVSFFETVGIPLAGYAALLVAVVEFFGGALMILGLLTRYVSMLQMVIMLVAFFTVHLNQGFNGYKFVLVLMASLLVVMTSGPGKLALGKGLKNKALQ